MYGKPSKIKRAELGIFANLCCPCHPSKFIFIEQD